MGVEQTGVGDEEGQAGGRAPIRSHQGEKSLEDGPKVGQTGGDV